MVVSLLAILKAGAAYIPLDPSYPRPRLSLILNDAQAPFLLTQPELLETLPDHSAHAICLDAERQAISEQSTDEPGVNISALSPAYIIYTSGSTGRPKGVQIRIGRSSISHRDERKPVSITTTPLAGHQSPSILPDSNFTCR